MIRFFSALGTESLLEILLQSPDATAIYTGAELNIQLANDAMLKIWGKDRSVLGKRFQDGLPELQGQPFTELLKNVWETGEIYEARDMPATMEINDVVTTSYFDFIYTPIKDKDDKIYCILHTAADVTERVNAWNLVGEKEKREQKIRAELTVLNEELQIRNEELAVLNEEYTATNEQLDVSNRIINDLNERLKNENQDLLLNNKEFRDNITYLDNFNKSLEFRNKELKDLNDTITQLNIKFSDSETSFSNLIAQAPVAMMLVKGKDYTVTLINDSMLQLIGKDRSIIGKPLFEELPELVGQPAADLLVETFQTGQSQSDYSNPVILNRRGKLEKGYFNFNYTPFIENGKITGVIDIAMEVTPQVEAIQQRDETILEKTVLEETLRNSEQRLRGILETMAEGVGVTDIAGQLIYANPMAQKILGLTESKIKKRTYDDPHWQNFRLDGSLLPSEEHPMSIMLSTGKPVYDHEIAVQAPGKDRIYISINAAPIFDSDGTLTGGIGTFMDVTNRRISTQSKDDFINIASHELKTPVTALKASLQLLQRSHEKLPAESRGRLLGQSVKSLDKLSQLITDLLDTSRIEQGQVKLDKKPFTISELFDDCCSSLAQNAEQRIIFQGDTEQIVHADNQQIGQVMVNFITNAIKYAPESEEIIISAHKINDHEIKITVKDQGPGIPPEKLSFLFDRYYRTNYKGQKFTGLGLGLYISADIIKKHGGKIGVESTEGSGSEFWFTLPI
jgi:PAS domain S-box-containing protein